MKCALVLLCAPPALASGQASFPGYAYYDLYGGGYEPDNYHDDWFYDYFALGERNAPRIYDFAEYDHARGRFVWEDGSLRDDGARRPPEGDPERGDDGAPSMRVSLASNALPPVCTESEAERRRRMNAVRSAEGRIVRTKTIQVRDAFSENVDARRQEDLHNVVAMVATEHGQRRLVVDLGPVGQVEPHVLRPGQRVAAEGFVKRVGDRQLLVAERIATADGRPRVLDRGAQARMAERALASLRNEGPPAGSDGEPANEAEADGGGKDAPRPDAGTGSPPATDRQGAPPETGRGARGGDAAAPEAPSQRAPEQRAPDPEAPSQRAPDPEAPSQRAPEQRAPEPEAPARPPEQPSEEEPPEPWTRDTPEGSEDREQAPSREPSQPEAPDEPTRREGTRPR